jgi:hypothetical protein
MRGNEAINVKEHFPACSRRTTGRKLNMYVYSLYYAESAAERDVIVMKLASLVVSKKDTER